MKIYTKRGDAGETGLVGGQRVPKDHLRIQAYGTLDELNSALGVAVSQPDLELGLKDRIHRIQSEIFQLGSELATPQGKASPAALVGDTETTLLESEIDEMEASLKPLQNFILPGGSRAGAHLHLARTVSRRAEREMIVLNRAEPLRLEILRYVNRLSDYLFVAARHANHTAGVEDIPWKAPKPG